VFIPVTLFSANMAPPRFEDLGKPAADVFNKGYNLGSIKLEHKLKSKSGVEFKTTAAQPWGTTKLTGGLDLKYKVSEYGLTVTEKLKTDQAVTTDIAVEDYFMKGLKIGAETTMFGNDKAGIKDAKIKADYVDEWLNTNKTIDILGRTCTLSGVFGRPNTGLMFGSQLKLDLQNVKLLNHNFVLGYQCKDFEMHSFVNDTREFGADVYHKCSPTAELAATLAWKLGEDSTKFGVGCSYALDPRTTLRGKLLNTNHMGVAVTHALNSGLKINLSALVNLAGVTNATHQFGVGIEYEG